MTAADGYFASLMPLVPEAAIVAADRAMQRAIHGTPGSGEAVFLVGVRALLERGTVNVDDHHRQMQMANSLIAAERDGAKEIVQRNAENIRQSLEALGRIARLVDARRKTLRMDDLIKALGIAPVSPAHVDDRDYAAATGGGTEGTA